MRIVSIGECMAELAPLDMASAYRLGYAGDTLNTAWYLARLRPDWAVDYVTAIGTDAMSDAMLAFFAQAGLGTAHVLRDPERTVGLYLISLADGERSFSYWRGQSAARCLAADPVRLTSALENADAVYISGITLAILDGAGRETLLEALAAVRSAGAVVAFDPNLRPRLWSDVSTMQEAVMRAAAISDIALPSHEDEAATFGDAGPQATRDRYLEAGARVVVVKDGPGGIHFSADGKSGLHRPDTVAEVIDSTAAGDSFNAAFLAAWLDRAPMAGAVTAASRLAGRVIGHRGALMSAGAWRTET